MRLKVLLVAAIFAISVMGFYSPAQAADGVTPYANIMTWMGWTQNSKERMSPTNTEAKSDLDYSQSNFANAGSNMGIKGEKNGVSAQIEFGVKTGFEDFRSRHVFASYKMGELGLLFGQTLAPYVALDGADLRSGDAMATSGSCYDGWISQIRLSFMGAYFQVMNPVTPATPLAGGAWDVVIPKVAAGYMFKTDAFSVAGNAVFQQMKWDKQLLVTAAAEELDGTALNSWLLNVVFKANFGPANVSAVAFYAKNRGNLGFASYNPAASTSAFFVTADNEYEDTTSVGGRVGAGFKVSDAIKFNVGLGYEKDENDAVLYGSDGKDEAMAYFVNAQIFLQANCYIAPELKVVDYKKTTAGVKDGKITYVGAAFVASI